MGRLFYILFFATKLSLVYAASSTGEVHAPSVWDLKWKFVSFAIVMIGIVKFSKKPIKDSFDAKHMEISQSFDDAERKYKEAQFKLEMFQEKMTNLDGHIKTIMNEASESVNSIKERIDDETKDRLKLIEKELIARVESEKQILENQLNDDLVDEVILKAKNKIVKDGSLKTSVTKKLMSGI